MYNVYMKSEQNVKSETALSTGSEIETGQNRQLAIQLELLLCLMPGDTGSPLKQSDMIFVKSITQTFVQIC